MTIKKQNRTQLEDAIAAFLASICSSLPNNGHQALRNTIFDLANSVFDPINSVFNPVDAIFYSINSVFNPIDANF
ncbi:MAG: hypothetical protein HC840_26395 [Leptolyngbyaceae cyanobacterium RM2_2_4]|nr:hypothetical protein [Leptolyngbyaceae cyanobacterium RM2_2_4]